MRIRTAAAGALGAVLLGTSIPATVHGQASPPSQVRAAVTLLPDTVLVGQPFRLGVTVQAPRGLRIRFPGALELTDDLEQVGAVELGHRRPRTGVMRAYYRVVAWTAGEHSVPPIHVELYEDPAAGDPLDLAVAVPPLIVRTVLPADARGLELRQGLPFLGPSPFPWLALLLLIAILVGLWAYHRYRKRDETADEAVRVLTSWERALEELRALAEEWRTGRLTPDAFGDGLEGILWGYLVETEGWVPGRPVRAAVNGDRRFARALDYSARVRFARLEGGYGGPIEATDACQAWIVSRHEPAGAPEEAP